MVPDDTFSMKPHAICLPFPAQSHIGAMLNLAKLLHHRGLCITFVNTEFNHRRLLEAGGPSFLDDLPVGFQFVAIPDGLPPSQANATQNLASLCESAWHLMGAPICTLIGDLNGREDSVSGFPPVSCIVADATMTLSADIASEKYGIPLVNLYTISACAMLAFRYLPKLKEKGLMPPNGMMNMRIRDMPTMDGTMDPDDIILNFSAAIQARFDKGIATIIHTVEPLEVDVLNALSSMAAIPVYAVGPFQLLIDRNLENENRLKHIGSNLWKEDTDCLQWLDSQKPESVLYINFGSIAFLTSQQLIEFAMGIANSSHPFLWIIRPDLVKGDAAILPLEFNETTKGRAFISEWCPQEEVLNHPSVGGFLTHCGWNSTLETLTAGVPMLCWPFMGDQRTICKYTCSDWEVGLEIGSDVKRDEVERVVKELMEREKGKQMKRRAMEWKQIVFEATSEHGSSSINLDKIVSKIISNK
ncbi:hypothetical protein CDL15_Pgr028826 [Punica granatum]|uniref:Glycosyltransferase n=1 Tax=Punica granatum TaxID=22663 RepID=A0A218WXE9_PUNGR|nr:hypothetical protein CDL15_Pgr028826 [Punica granatum]